jgi:hypothetical protein
MTCATCRRSMLLACVEPSSDVQCNTPLAVGGLIKDLKGPRCDPDDSSDSGMPRHRCIFRNQEVIMSYAVFRSKDLQLLGK